jgi:hypothetical protein
MTSVKEISIGTMKHGGKEVFSRNFSAIAGEEDLGI